MPFRIGVAGVDPSLRGKPVSVAVSRTGSRTWCAASYEARDYGIIQPCRCAAQHLCPLAFFCTELLPLTERYGPVHGSTCRIHAGLERPGWMRLTGYHGCDMYGPPRISLNPQSAREKECRVVASVASAHPK
jgi:nucleotidyltransferase/DNA polymerase involved in DNA repair